MPLQFGVFILLKIFHSWNQFKDVLHAGSVVAGGILLLETGLNPLTHVLHQLKWPTLHSRRSFSSISLAHDILHNRISIPFNKYFQFSFTNTRSHPQSLSIPSSTINPYRHSFFVNTPFLWNSIPHSILQLSNRVAFHSALRRFLFV